MLDQKVAARLAHRCFEAVLAEDDLECVVFVTAFSLTLLGAEQRLLDLLQEEITASCSFAESFVRTLPFGVNFRGFVIVVVFVLGVLVF